MGQGPPRTDADATETQERDLPVPCCLEARDPCSQSDLTPQLGCSSSFLSPCQELPYSVIFPGVSPGVGYSRKEDLTFHSNPATAKPLAAPVPARPTK